MANEALNFKPGRVLSGKYEIVSLLGAGVQGEVYRIRELASGIERAAKFFYPKNNQKDHSARLYANKLHKVRHCPVVTQYHSHDVVRVRGVATTYLIFEFVEGEVLSSFLERQPGGRLQVLPALHLLYALASGLDCIHRAGEYHGDLHSDNIIVSRFGLVFELKLLDLFHWQGSKRETMQFDVVEMVRVFYESLGGARHYARQPTAVKAICRGLKRSLIIKRFRTAARLKAHLENLRLE